MNNFFNRDQISKHFLNLHQDELRKYVESVNLAQLLIFFTIGKESLFEDQWRFCQNKAYCNLARSFFFDTIGKYAFLK
jgi:hypothetical protein